MENQFTSKTDSVIIEPSPICGKTSKHLGSDTCTCMKDQDDVMLTTKLAKLQLECSKRNKDHFLATTQSLTSSIFSSRWKWITDVQPPPVIEILERYPSLKIWKVLSYLLKHFNIVIILHVCIASLFQFRMEFKTLIGLDEKTSIHSLMESWPTWEKNDCLFFIGNQA